jgi:ferredoxin-NADP reductase
MPEWLKRLLRPAYFRINHWRGNPGQEIYTLAIREIIHEYDDVCTFILDRPANLNFQAGQYCHVIAPGAILDNHHVQHISFANAPHEDRIMISMDLASGSRFKRRFQKAAINDTLGLFSIRGEFILDADAQGRPVLFIAGGIGIAPIRSLISHIEAQGTPEWSLVYAGRNHLYKNFWSPFTGRVSLANRQTVFTSIEASLQRCADPLVYVCGSGEFLRDINTFLVAQGIPVESIHTENFTD